MPKTDNLPMFIDECYSMSRDDILKVIQDLYVKVQVAEGIRRWKTEENGTPPQTPPEAPVAKTRTRTAKKGDKAKREEVEQLAHSLSPVEFENFEGTIDSNRGMKWHQRSTWVSEEWDYALSVVKGKK